MIVKILREKITDLENGAKGTDIFREFYRGNSIEFSENGIVVDKKVVSLGNYDHIDEISKKTVHCNILSAFIMNDEGKTIERLV